MFTISIWLTVFILPRNESNEKVNSAVQHPKNSNQFYVFNAIDFQNCPGFSVPYRWIIKNEVKRAIQSDLSQPMSDQLNTNQNFRKFRRGKHSNCKNVK